MDTSHIRRWRPAELPGVEVLSIRAADYTHPRFTLNSGYVIKIRHHGPPPPVRYRGREQTAGAAGAVTVVEPGEVMQSLGKSATTAELDVLVVDPGLMPACTPRENPPRFHRLTYLDSGLFNGIAALHNNLTRGEDRLTLQSTFTGLLDTLVTRHATTSGATSPTVGHRALHQVRQLLHDRLDTNIGLDELAAVAGYSPHHLLRSFRQAYGVPPHRYRTLLRLDRARSMLAAGRSVADVAAELGYFDQSQLNRHFRQAFGMSAGTYARTVR